MIVRETMHVGERPSYKRACLIESRDRLIDMVSTYTLKRVRREKKATVRRREREREREREIESERGYASGRDLVTRGHV